MRQDCHVVARLHSGRMGASVRPAMRLPLRQGLARGTHTKHNVWIRAIARPGLGAQRVHGQGALT